MFICSNLSDAGTKFHIKNTTEVKLNIALGNKFIILPAGETFTITTDKEFGNEFDEKIARLNVCSVFSNDTMLKTWRHSDRNDGGKQFFNKYSWETGRETDENDVYLTYTFEITPEDLGL